MYGNHSVERKEVVVKTLHHVSHNKLRLRGCWPLIFCACDPSVARSTYTPASTYTEEDRDIRWRLWSFLFLVQTEFTPLISQDAVKATFSSSRSTHPDMKCGVPTNSVVFLHERLMTIFFRWEELLEGSVLRWLPKGGRRVSTHIVAFDMDGTLIKSKSGEKRLSCMLSDSVHSFPLPCSGRGRNLER